MTAMVKSKTDKGAKVSTVFCAIRGLCAMKGLSSINGRLVGGVTRTLGIGMIVGGAGLLASCHSAVTQGRAASYPVIDSLLGSSATKAGQVGTFSSILQSDVLTKNSIFEDPGQVTMHVEMKDITGTGPTPNNNITFNHYRVVFRRTDGRNVQGIDVPYAFEGAVTFTVTPGGASSGFTLVRVQSKLEPPLITMQNDGGAIVISTIADVTFYGKDQTGTDVSVTGSISVNFSDWGDPAS
jgi:hypothetical protein